MADQKEILRYEFDITDVEAKTAKLRQMMDEIKAKRGAGEDTSELEAQFHKEADALGRSTQATKQASGATEDLVRQKDKLANVVSLVGGQFGGLVGQLGNVVELIMRGGKAAIGFGVALVALAAGAKVFRDIKAAAEEAAKAQERYNEAVRAGQSLKLTETQAMASQLETWGARTEANVKAAEEMHRRLRKDYGTPTGLAAQTASLAVAAGLSVEDAARLRVLIGGEASISTPEEAQQALEQARKDQTYEGLLEQAAKFAGDLAGEAETQLALAPNVGGTGRMSPEQAAYEGLKKQPGGLAASGLPANLTFEEFVEIAHGEGDESVEAAQFARRHGLYGDMEIPTWRGWEPIFVNPAQDMKWRRLRDKGRQHKWLKGYIEQVSEVGMGLRPSPNEGPLYHEPEGVPASGGATQQTINNYNDNRVQPKIGTQYNRQDLRRHFHPLGSDHKAPHPQ